ncbi:MAG: HU family DNA-binding protein [Gammaproteobacteria bacterium]|nr:HU family DNA-binding protein [Gammaproteobacteria bacterium]
MYAEGLSEDDKIELRGFDSFRTRSRNAWQGRNLRTGDAVEVLAKKVPCFRSEKDLWEKEGLWRAVRSEARCGARRVLDWRA